MRGKRTTGVPGVCVTCGRQQTIKGHGECGACWAYRRKWGKPRPYGPVDARNLNKGRWADANRWLGDRAGDAAKRLRAQKLYTVLGSCARCKVAPATDRHHRDRDPGNNGPENLAFYCKSCHGKLHHEEAVARGEPWGGRGRPKGAKDTYRRHRAPTRRATAEG